MANHRYSISDIAGMLGVSKSTVSRAVNGKRGVSEELREKILELVDEVGYRPSTLAQGLYKGRVNIVTLIVGDIRNPFYAALVFNIQRILIRHNYMVMTFNSEYDVQRELEFVELTLQFNFAGLILITAQTESMKNKLNSIDIPKVLVNRNFPSYDGDYVLADNFQAGYRAAMHLIDLGHQRIGFVRGPGLSTASSQRFEGFKQALKNYNLQLYDEYIFDSDLKMETGSTLAEKFSKLEKYPSAMVIVNDMTSIGFIDGCRERGIRVPEDLSIVSFDNIDLASVKGIELTTIDQHVDQMSEHAARMILKQLEGEKETKPERIILEPTLVIRKTTMPCSE